MGLLGALTVLVPAAVAPVAPAAADLEAAASTSVAAGGSHSCGVTTSGSVRCWGDNTYGQLGNGTTTDSTSPVQVTGLTSGVVAVATGINHSCALTNAGGVKCWGGGGSGELGNGSTLIRTTPVPVVGLTSGVTAVAAGAHHTCAVTDAGAAKCWGRNAFGTLGNGSTTNSSTPVSVSGLGSGVAAITTGNEVTCALTTGGGVKCWGIGNFGSLGNGSTANATTPVDVTGLGSGVTGISSGGFHSCAVLSGGTAKCWGANGDGELGDGTTTQANTPVTVAGLSSVSAIGSGNAHSCAVTQSGGVQCWGDGSLGQLGVGTASSSSTAAPVTGLSSGVTALTVGSGHNCALMSNKTLKCWGSNDQGQLGTGGTGIGSPAYVDVPQVPAGLDSGVTAIDSGNATTCAIVSGGAVQCWGGNSDGQLGIGSTTPSYTPVTVSSLGSGVTAISVGGGEPPARTHVCAVDSAGAAKCWGANNFGQLGNGTTTDSSTPVTVSGLSSGVVAVAAGSNHACALTTAGAVSCWGAAGSGELGNGTTTNSSTPVPVSGLSSGVTALAAGDNHACALNGSGGVECWGRNAFGALGNATTTDSSVPVSVSGLDSGVSAVAAGHDFSCALSSGGAVSCWGMGAFGQLGNGGNSGSPIPVGVSGLASGATALAAGGFHTCAVAGDGFTKCWGANSSGELGNATLTNSNTPVNVVNVPNGGTISVAAGQDTSCRIRNGGAHCWGENSDGQLGLTPTSWLPASAATGFTFGPAGALSVAKSAEETTVEVGEAIHYEVTVTNTGNITLHDVTVTDANAPSCDGNLGTLAVGASDSVECTHVAVAGNVPSYANTASATAQEVTTPAVSNTVNTTVTPEDLDQEWSTSLAGGQDHTCALTISGAAMCWGLDGRGQLGNAAASHSTVPVAVSGMGSGVAVIAAGNRHNCALTTAGATSCWGINEIGELGNAANSPDSHVPVAVSGMGSGVQALGAGRGHSCAVTAGGAARCWGLNTLGQLGNNTADNSNVPVQVTGLTSGVTRVDAGSTHSCAVTDVGALKCWGENSVGQVGDGTTTQRHTPVAVSGLSSGVADVVVGSDFTCALTTAGAVKCWGANYLGMLGDGTTTNSSVPVDVSGLGSGVQAIAAGPQGNHACALTSAGAVRCWGSSGYGQLGNGASVNSSTPVSVTGLGSGVRAISVGNFHSCALTAAGAARCWGRNDSGQLGNGTTTSSDVPVAVSGGHAFGLPVSSMTVAKSADETSVIEGATINYDVTVTNTGNVALTNVAVDDPNADCPSTPVATVAVGANTVVECTHVTVGADIGTYSNTASATSAEITSSVDSNTVDVSVIAQNPSLDVDKSADESAVLVGATINYDVEVSNTGNVVLHDVVVDDPDADCPSTPIATLAVGAEQTVECTHVAVTGDIGTYSNVASATSTEVTTPVDSNQVDVAVSPVPAPSLTAVKSADQPSVVAGQPIDYSIVITNTGNVSLTGITVTDADAPDCDGPVPDLAVGAAHTVECTYTTVSPGDVGTYSNTASVDSAQTSPQDSNTVDVTVVAQAPAVTLTQTVGETSVPAGDDINYQLTVSNTGNVGLSGVAITDNNAPDCAGPVANLAAGASTTVNCAYTTVNPGDIGLRANGAFVTSTQGAVAMSNLVVTTVTAPAALEVTKSAAQTTVEVGGAIDYEVTVTNTGGSVAHQVTVDDPNAPDCDGVLGALAPGAEVTVECSFVTDAGDAGTYTNVASATADEVTTPVDSNQVDVAVTEFPAGVGTVSGAVTTTGSGDPIPGALLAFLSSADFSMVAGLQADAAGAYEGRVPVGDYFVYVIDPAGGHTAGFHGAPTLVSVTEGGSVVADPAMVATTGAIAGTVTEDGSGDPVADTVFMGIDLNTGQPGPGAISGPAGNYVADGLAPGNHLGTFIDLSGGHVPEYYDDSPLPAGSLPVAVTAASTTGGIDASLAPQAPPTGGGRLVGTVTGASGGGDLEGIAVIALHAGTFAFAAGDVTDADGNYDISVDLGSYKVLFYDPSGARAAEWFNNTPIDQIMSSGTVTTTVAEPTKRRDVSLAPNEGAVSGTVVDAGGDPAGGVWVAFVGSTGALVATGVTGGDGTYTVTGIPAGAHRVTFVDPSGAHLQEYWDDATTFGAAELLTVAAGDTVNGIDAALTASP